MSDGDEVCEYGETEWWSSFESGNIGKSHNALSALMVRTDKNYSCKPTYRKIFTLFLSYLFCLIQLVNVQKGHTKKCCMSTLGMKAPSMR